ncbi:RICIN domain-containing protein [Microbacterium sp. RURRCA19A]|uniref:RICIN domain-containing protein n=1 Tax=Microbacterium sp. RURRCA19A TaxID=1907391 RepID=UPI0009567AAF|nr:RICIN domain-containing protein [Microbacterium sp. RURRCA19A]SIR96921.1 Ricin-type beta-trefoil lectin domain-like [Microbacterium sp. RURRCA19A]
MVATTGLAAIAVAALSATGAQAALVGGPTFSVTVGTPASGPAATDTPAYPYIDKDGTYYHQQSAALYGADEVRKWDFYSGTNLETATRSTAISDAVNPANSLDRNNDTTWRCNNSPTGLTATDVAGDSYSQKNFCDLAGVWVDPDSGDWYGLVHNEFTGSPFGDGSHFDAIDYAVSSDQGKTWTIRDHALTSPFSTTRGDSTAFPNQTYYYGDGDQRLFVDAASGYFYVYYGSRVINKTGGWTSFQSHVARAPIADKMAPSSWRKWYNGAWTEPGVGGRESSLTPVTSSDQTGYLPTALEYKPSATGTSAQQIAAGTLAPTSPLFVMDIAWNAYLGMYIGEPQAVDQSGNAPQQFYGTTDLTTQKWTLLGDTGSYTTSSWYRFFLDPANKTSNLIVGKDFRAYCYISCQSGSGSQYVPVSISPSAGADAPLDASKTYRIAGAGGRLLSQDAAGTTAVSVASGTTSGTEWYFTPVGDGSYTITNATSGTRLGVSAAATSTRAWGTVPTTTLPVGASGAVGQQWWVVRERSASTNQPTGALRLINRYSGLALNLTSTASRTAETAPVRAWTDASGSTVGAGRTAAQQALTLTAVGTAPVSADLSGNRTITSGGKAVDVPDHSTTTGKQLALWSPSGGLNQSFAFTRNADGSYQIKGRESNLCLDVADNSTAAGGKIIQWTCSTSANQRWIVETAGAGYTIRSASSGLLLSAASATNGALLVQQTPAGAAVQVWSIG